MDMVSNMSIRDAGGNLYNLPKEVFVGNVVLESVSYYGVRALRCVNWYYNGLLGRMWKELEGRFVRSGVEKDAGEYRRYVGELRELEEIWKGWMYWKVLMVNSYCSCKEDGILRKMKECYGAMESVVERLDQVREIAGRDRKDLEKVVRFVGVEGFRVRGAKEGSGLGEYLRGKRAEVYRRFLGGGVLLKGVIGVDRVERCFGNLCVSLVFGYGLYMFSYVVLSTLSWLGMEFLCMGLGRVVGLGYVKEAINLLREVVVLKGVHYGFMRIGEELADDFKEEGVGKGNASVLGGYLALLTIVGLVVGSRVF